MQRKRGFAALCRESHAAAGRFIRGNLVIPLLCMMALPCVAAADEPVRIEGLSSASALSWSLVVAVAIAATHVFSPHLRRLIESSEGRYGSFGEGMAAAYVFVHLLVELDAGHEVIGNRIHALVLVGFLAYYGIEIYLTRRFGSDAPQTQQRSHSQMSATSWSSRQWQHRHRAECHVPF